MHDNEMVTIVMTAGQAKSLRRAAIVVKADIDDVELELGHRRLDAALDQADGTPSIETLLQAQQVTLEGIWGLIDGIQTDLRDQANYPRQVTVVEGRH